ncbi:MAG TPA: hypothetical protein VH680_14540 [Gemmatimonadales bacterium]
MLALGTALLGRRTERRLGAAGLICLGLALAALQASAGETAGRPAVPQDRAEAFFVVNGGLLLLGLGLLLRAAAAEGPWRTRPLSRGVIVLGAGLMLWLIAGQLQAGGLVPVALSAIAAGLAGTALAAIIRIAASTSPARAAGRRLFTQPLGPPAVSRGPATVQLLALLAAGATAALGPHVLPVFVGVLVAVWSGYRLVRPMSGRRLPVALTLVLVLAPAYWLLATIAGPIGLWIGELHLVPLSPAAESLLAAAMLLSAWNTAGLWPLHRQLPGVLVGVVGALLLVRVALPLTPAGLEQWRPLMVPVLVVGSWHAAAHGRWPLVAVGSAFQGIVSPAQMGMIGAWWLLGAALVLEVAAMAASPLAGVRVAPILAWVSAAWGGLLVLEAGLRGEVVYTAVGTLGLALLIVAPLGGPLARVDPPGLARHPSLRPE